MKVRCKMVCDETSTRDNYGEKPIYRVKMSVVMDGSAENEEFFQYTPAGSIDLDIMAAQYFEIGKEYYVDFTPAE